MNEEYSNYLDYLKQRNRMGWLYRNLWLYPWISRFLQGRVLDVGCGIGDFLRFRPGSAGVDINPAIVSWCRQQGLDVHPIIAGQIPYPNGHFNGAVLDNVLEHLAQPEPLLAEIGRILSDDGTLIVGVPGTVGFAADPDHKIHYSETSLIETMRSCGYVCKHIRHMPFRWRYLEKTLRQYCIYGVFRLDHAC